MDGPILKLCVLLFYVLAKSKVIPGCAGYIFSGKDIHIHYIHYLIYVSINTYMHTYMLLYTYIYIHIHTYIHTYIHTVKHLQLTNSTN